MPNQVKVNALAFAHLVREMLAGEYTCAELAERTGLHYVTVLRYTREMYKVGAAYICAWGMDERRRYTLKVYKVGNGMDARKPRSAMTPAQRTQKYRMKLKRRQEYEQRQHQSAALPKR